jgi:predicted N-acetyltransferase YhbS
MQGRMHDGAMTGALPAVNAVHRGAGIGSGLIAAGERELRDSGFQPQPFG